MATTDKNPQDRHATARANFEKSLTARIAKGCGFGSEPLDAVEATLDVRCLVTSVIDGLTHATYAAYWNQHL